MRDLKILKYLVLLCFFSLTITCSEDDNISTNSFIIDDKNSSFNVIDTLINPEWLKIDLNSDNKDDIQIITPNGQAIICDLQPCEYADFGGSLIYLEDSIAFLVEEEMDTIFHCFDEGGPNNFTNNSDYECDSYSFNKVYKLYSPKLFDFGDVILLENEWFYRNDTKHENINQLGNPVDFIPIVYKEKVGFVDDYYDETVDWSYYYVYGNKSNFTDKYIIYKILNSNAEWKYGWIKLNLEDYCNLQITQISYQND